MNIISKGIDISRWQGDFDLARAREEGFEFVIIKGAGGDDGLYTDSKFVKNYENATRLGISKGAYFFSRALTVEEAVKEADYFYEHCLKGRRFELPVYMDVEQKDQLALGKRALTDIIHAFCQRLEEKGFWVGIYASTSVFKSCVYDTELQRYAHWVAQWAKSCGYEGSCMGMWQYGGEVNNIRSNKVAGVTCDQNYMLTDYPSLIKAKGCNGFTAAREEPSGEAEEPAVKTVAELAQEVIQGLWGNGQERKDRLTAAGYDYKAVQAEVDRIFATAQDKPTSGPDADKKGTYKVTAKIGLNLRSGPSTDKKIIETMAFGAQVECYGYHTGSWLYVVAPSGNVGFCHADYLSKV